MFFQAASDRSKAVGKFTIFSPKNLINTLLIRRVLSTCVDSRKWVFGSDSTVYIFVPSSLPCLMHYPLILKLNHDITYPSLIQV